MDDGPGLLPFKLGPTRIVAYYHSFLNYIDLNNIHLQINLVKDQLLEFRPILNNKTLYLYDPHIKHLNNKISRLSDQLHTFEPNRIKRGLIDGLGSVIKSISGNLDYTDAVKYDKAIKELQNNEIRLESEFNSHVSLNKEWISCSTKVLDKIVENQKNISNALNLIMQSDSQRETELIKYAHLAQHLIILGDNIEDLSQEMLKLENTLAFIRASSTPHSIITLDDLNSILHRLRTLYSKDEVPDVSYRDFYDIIKLGYFYIDTGITIVIKMPIVYPLSYDLYKLPIIPNKHHKALIPILPYIAISGKDFTYLRTECPKINSWFLCQAPSNYQIQTEPDCIQNLIVKQEIHPSCKMTSVIIKKEALEQLDDRHYTLCFPNATKVKISCGQEQYRILHGSFLAVIPFNCYLKTTEFTIANTNERIKGHVVKLMEMPQYDESGPEEHPSVVLNSLNLETLHSLNTKISLQPPVHLNQATDSTIYHTTIPVYIILLCVVALIVVVASRRLRKRCLRNQIEIIQSGTDISRGIYATPDTSRPDPSQIKVDLRNISSTISNKVRK